MICVVSSPTRPLSMGREPALRVTPPRYPHPVGGHRRIEALERELFSIDAEILGSHVIPYALVGLCAQSPSSITTTRPERLQP